MSDPKIPKRPLLRYFGGKWQLRYFGGKWQLRHWIISHLPDHQFYAEPFAGAASVLLGKPPAPKGEIINDLNGDVVNLFRVMQGMDTSEELLRRLEWTPYAQAELVVSREPTDDAVERARRMAIRSFMGNVDLSRLDQDGKRTFRNCARDWSNWKEQLSVIRERLAEVMVYQRDAIEFIGLMDNPDCLLYVDPPYHHDTRSATRYAVEFEDHVRLVRRLLACKAMVVLSGYRCEAYEPLEAAGWQRIEKDYRANMSKDRRTECLWRSPGAVAKSESKHSEKS